MNAAMYPDLIINGETVPYAVVAAETQNHEAPRGKPGIAWRKAANAVAVRTLLLQEAQRRGIVPERAQVGPGRFETDEEAQIRGLLEAAVDAESPSDTDIRLEWDRDPSRFRSPPLWEVSHILIACDPRDETQKAEALKRANAVLESVNAKPRNFARIATEHSDCGSKSSGGALGQINPGETVPEFEAVLRDLREGDVTEAPVLTRHGYHIIKIDAFAEGAVLPFEAVRPKISDAMEKAAWARHAKAFVNDLVSRAEITGAELAPI
jgi:peptidyl-prolyl cis-trans isomerase C